MLEEVAMDGVLDEADKVLSRSGRPLTTRGLFEQLVANHARLPSWGHPLTMLAEHLRQHPHRFRCLPGQGWTLVRQARLDACGNSPLLDYPDIDQ